PPRRTHPARRVLGPRHQRRRRPTVEPGAAATARRDRRPYRVGVQRLVRRRRDRPPHPPRRAGPRPPRRRWPLVVPDGPPLRLGTVPPLATPRRRPSGAGRLPDRLRAAVRDDRTATPTQGHHPPLTGIRSARTGRGRVSHRRAAR